MNMQSSFAGAMLGTFAGDALGMPVENWSARRIAQTFGTLDRMVGASPWLRMYAAAYSVMKAPTQMVPASTLGAGTYTDDTQMMIAVAESLVACRGFDGADMARRFVACYEPRRGYGGGTVRALQALRRGEPWDRVGAQLFDGTGSFGNGAAMRAAPLGLLYHDDPAELRRVAEQASAITHAHPLGREGGVLLAYAVACALQCHKAGGLEPDGFLADLQAFLSPDAAPLRDRLQRVGELLRTQPDVETVVQTLGNRASAITSVPAALYAVLAHPDSFRDAVVYAVSLGGDTDTIGAMAGAVAGACHGVEAIPEEWLAALENGPKGRDHVRKLAEDLLTVKR